MDRINCLAFGAHPDDVELSCSGLLIKLKRQGFTTGVIDLTQSELSTNGTIETRKMESRNAEKILQLDVRRNLEIPDGNIKNSIDNRLKIIKIIREYQSDIILQPYWEDRHPDHKAASKLITDSCFYSGLSKIETEQESHRPKSILYYMMHTTFTPTFIVDITNEMETKIAAIQAYQSQFGGDVENIEVTFINKPEFLDFIKDRAKFYGYKINAQYGEPYFFKGNLKLDNIMQIFA